MRRWSEVNLKKKKHFCIPKFFPFNVLTSLPGTYVTNIEIKTKSIEKADKHSTDNKYIWQEYIFMFWITNKNEIRDNVFIYLVESDYPHFNIQIIYNFDLHRNINSIVFIATIYHSTPISINNTYILKFSTEIVQAMLMTHWSKILFYFGFVSKQTNFQNPIKDFAICSNLQKTASECI